MNLKIVALDKIIRRLVKEEYLMIILGGFFLFLHKNIRCRYSLDLLP